MTNVRLRHLLARFAFAALLGGPALACGPKGMKKVEIPAAGIQMAYDLDPGATYQGHLRIGNTQTVSAEGQQASINQALECDVRLEVLGNDPQHGGTAVRASFANIDLKWGLPASAPISPAEFTRDALAQLQGLNVTFNVLPTGEIVYMPVPPQQMSDELKGLIDQVLRGLEEAFLVVPKHAVKDGETWSEDEHRGRKGKLGRYVEGKVTTKVDGMYHHGTLDEDVVKLVIELKRKETFTTKDGSRETESTEKSTALFSTAGYLAQVEGESKDYDPVNGMSYRKVRVEWKKTADGTPGGAAVAPTQEQTITDPCDPDYVGEAECKDGSEQQAITDPCDPDYVGEGECKDEAAKPEGTPPAATTTPPK